MHPYFLMNSGKPEVWSFYVVDLQRKEMKCSHWCEYLKVTTTQSRPGFKPRSGHMLGRLTPPRFVKSQQNDKVNLIFAVEAP